MPPSSPPLSSVWPCVPIYSSSAATTAALEHNPAALERECAAAENRRGAEPTAVPLGASDGRATPLPRRSSHAACSRRWSRRGGGPATPSDVVVAGLWCLAWPAPFFLFPDQRSGCVALPFVIASSSTLPKTRLSLCPSGCCGNARDPAILAGDAAFSGGGATHAAGPRHAGSRSESAPIAARSRTPPPILLKEDAVALFSCTIYHRSRPIVLLTLSARSC